VVQSASGFDHDIGRREMRMKRYYLGGKVVSWDLFVSSSSEGCAVLKSAGAVAAQKPEAD
jgi:hypothetical protein